MKPCPVDIDFGDVSVAMRNFLRKQDKKRFSPGTAASLKFLIVAVKPRERTLRLEPMTSRPTSPHDASDMNTSSWYGKCGCDIVTLVPSTDFRIKLGTARM